MQILQNKVDMSLLEGRTSTEFKWNLQQVETFHIFDVTFNILEAKRILAREPRFVQKVIVADWTPMLKLIHMAPLKEGQAVDFSWPIILGDAKGKSRKPFLLPIDGWHRLQLAQQLGIPELPAFALTARETQTIQEEES